MGHFDFFGKNMDHCLLLCLFFLLFNGVDANEMKSIPVNEGESVTLNTDTTIEEREHIMWTFGSKHTSIADIYSASAPHAQNNYVNSEIFKDRLHVDYKTGSLTIRNIRITDSGLYYLNKITPTRRTESTTFNVTVYSFSYAALKSKSRICSSERSSLTKLVFFFLLLW